MGAVITADGSVVLGGYTYGSWMSPNKGGADLVVIKLDSEKEVLWTLQVIVFS